MPVRKMRERDIPELGFNYNGGVIVPVDVVNDDGTEALIRVQGTGVLARIGQEYTVPASAVRWHWEDL